MAYTTFLGDWKGSCTIGIIKLAFFFVPKESESSLGVPVYDDLRKTKRKMRNVVNMESTQRWKGKIWTPEEIIKTYGPATWAQDGSRGYHTPIYMLNQIIQLQAVLEVVSNRTALALDHISNQLAQTRTVIYQIWLAVDYLLADEGGICAKFNSSKCCLEIKDKSEVIRNISTEMCKIAHVGTQEWAPLMDTSWWDDFWSFKGKWWKKAAFMAVTALTSLLFLPCLLPCLVWTILSTIKASTQVSKTATQTKIMVLESQKEEHKAAKRTYDQYQKLRRFYSQETKITNWSGINPDQKERWGNIVKNKTLKYELSVKVVIVKSYCTKFTFWTVEQC